MLSILSGAVLFGAGATGLWHFLPRNGRVHPLATKPFLDSMIPIAIVSVSAIGLAMMIAGAV